MRLLKSWISLGSLFAPIGVSLGAFGAHVLKTRLSGREFEIFQTADTYLLWHSVGLILFGLFSNSQSNEKFFTRRNAPALLFTFGIFLFSGSLFLILLTGQTFWGMITPLGGLSFIVGWLCFAYQASAKQS